jgi:hypothetical protein
MTEEMKMSIYCLSLIAVNRLYLKNMSQKNVSGPPPGSRDDKE